MDGKEIDFGIMSSTSSAAATSSNSASIFSRSNISGRSKQPGESMIQDEEFGFETSAATSTATKPPANIPEDKKDILPIDTDPWAETASSGAPSAIGTVAAAASSANDTPNLFPDNQETGNKSDDQSWANFDNMT